MAGINRDRNAFFDMVEGERRTSNIIMLGKVYLLDEQKARVKVKAGNLITGWLQVATLRAGEDRHFWLPEIGEQVVIASPNGDLNQGVVIGCIFSEKYPANDNKKTHHTLSYQDNAIFRYDREHHLYQIQLPSDGKVIINVGSSSLTIDGEGISLKAKKINLN